MCQLKILVIILLIVFIMTQNCQENDCQTTSKQVENKQTTLSDATILIDKQIRRVYWYYLWKSNKIYEAQLNTPQSYLIIYIYRNTVGTFLCLGSWDKLNNQPGVQNVVRLGNGYNPKQDSPYKPISIQPIILSLRFKSDEVYVRREKGQMKINGKQLSQQEENNIITDTKRKTSMVNKYLLQTYNHYLQGGTLLHSDDLLTNKKLYSIFTYVSLVGTFFAITSIGKDDKINVNTFVRLGAGSLSIQKIQPISVKAKILEMN